jgi:hypothetical protein
MNKLRITAAIGIFVVLLLAISAGSMFESVDAREYHVKQAAVSGDLTVHGDPGVYVRCLAMLNTTTVH